MTIEDVSAKIDLRLNKSASADYDNIWGFAKEEAFNKAVSEWVRRQKRGKNQTREGDEETTTRVDDLQLLLKDETLTSVNKGIYNETSKVPSDYLYFKRVTPYVTKGTCKNVTIKSSLREEANVDELRTMPSFDFEETFHTIINNRVRLYHNNDFSVIKIILTYYRKPKLYDFKKSSAIIEFKDDVCEMLVDEACAILASDMESFNAKQVLENRKEFNN